MGVLVGRKTRFPNPAIPREDVSVLEGLLSEWGSASDYQIGKCSPILRPMIRAVSKLATVEERLAYIEGFAAGSLIGRSIVKALSRQSFSWSLRQHIETTP